MDLTSLLQPLGFILKLLFPPTIELGVMRLGNAGENYLDNLMIGGGLHTISVAIKRVNPKVWEPERISVDAHLTISGYGQPPTAYSFDDERPVSDRKVKLTKSFNLKNFAEYQEIGQIQFHDLNPGENIEIEYQLSPKFRFANKEPGVLRVHIN